MVVFLDPVRSGCSSSLQRKQQHWLGVPLVNVCWRPLLNEIKLMDDGKTVTS